MSNPMETPSSSSIKSQPLDPKKVGGTATQQDQRKSRASFSDGTSAHTATDSSRSAGRGSYSQLLRRSHEILQKKETTPQHPPLSRLCSSYESTLRTSVVHQLPNVVRIRRIATQPLRALHSSSEEVPARGLFLLIYRFTILKT